MKVMGKGSRERHVGFSPAFAARLQKYLMRQALALKGAGLQDDGWLWLNQSAAGSLPHDAGPAPPLRRPGRPRPRPGQPTYLSAHASRPLVRAGGSPFHLQRALGHSTLEMTRRYCELSETDWLDAQRAHSLVAHLNLDPGGGLAFRTPAHLPPMRRSKLHRSQRREAPHIVLDLPRGLRAVPLRHREVGVPEDSLQSE